MTGPNVPGPIGVSSMCDSDEYTDLSIQCQNQTIRVHKVVVCSQSSYIKEKANEEKSAGKDHTIEMPFALEFLRAMKEFFYKSRYDVPEAWNEPRDDSSDDSDTSTVRRNPTSSGESDTEPKTPMLLHLEVRKLANATNMTALMLYAEKRFEDAASEDWRRGDFRVAVTNIYELPDADDPESTLHNIVAKIASRHIQDLYEKSKFTALMEDNPSFAADVTLAVAESSNAAKELVCLGCHMTWEMDRDSIYTSRICPNQECFNPRVMELTEQKKRYRCANVTDAGCGFVFETRFRSKRSFVCPVCDESGKIEPYD